jgi:hypothetical protein
MGNEVWKDIKGYEGVYQISDCGRLKSLLRTVCWIKDDGTERCRDVRERIMRHKVDKDGYHEYILCTNNKKVHRRAHRLVAQAFLPIDSEDGMVVDHKDGVKTNNTVSNLQWLTSEQNTIKYYSEEFHKSKTLSSLSREEWQHIGDLYNEGVLYKDIVTAVGITVDTPDSLWEGLSGKRLSSVTGFKKGDFKKRAHPIQKLDEDQVMEILKQRLIDKLPLKIISSKYGITGSMISRFCSGTRRPELLIKFKKEYNFE